MPVRKNMKTGSEVLSDLIERKAQWATSRFARRPEGIEKPRDVFLAACTEIAAAIEPKGFRYAKSGPRLTTHRGGLTCQIKFGSSYYNVAGASVLLDPSIWITSAKFGAWLRQHCRPWFRLNDGRLVISQLGYLLQPPRYLQWNLADPAERPEIIKDVVSILDAGILPYFDQFADPRRLAHLVAERDIPRLPGLLAAAFLLFAVGADAASEAIRGLLKRHEAYRGPFTQAVAEFRHLGVPSTPQADGIRCLAALTVAFDLPAAL